MRAPSTQQRLLWLKLPRTQMRFVSWLPLLVAQRFERFAKPRRPAVQLFPYSTRLGWRSMPRPLRSRHGPFSGGILREGERPEKGGVKRTNAAALTSD